MIARSINHILYFLGAVEPLDWSVKAKLRSIIGQWFPQPAPEPVAQNISLPQNNNYIKRQHTSSAYSKSIKFHRFVAILATKIADLVVEVADKIRVSPQLF